MKGKGNKSLRVKTPVEINNKCFYCERVFDLKNSADVYVMKDDILNKDNEPIKGIQSVRYACGRDVNGHLISLKSLGACKTIIAGDSRPVTPALSTGAATALAALSTASTIPNFPPEGTNG